jgi:tetratricopeptide (TPR) repeat protein
MTIELNPKLLNMVELTGTRERGTVVDTTVGTPAAILVELSDESGVPKEFLSRTTDEVKTVWQVPKAPNGQSEVPEAQQYFENGILYLQNGLVPQAKKELAKAFSLDQQLASVLLNRTNALAAQKSFASAIIVYEILFQLSPDYDYARQNLAITHLNRGVEFARGGFFSQAIADFDQALMLNPSADIVEAVRRNTAAVYGNLGVLFSEWKNHEQALQLFQWSLELNPSETARKNLALAQIAMSAQMRMPLTNDEILRKAMIVGLSLSECLNAYGATQAGLGELGEARRILQAALDADPRNEVARRNLATLVSNEPSVAFAVGVVRQDIHLSSVR